MTATRAPRAAAASPLIATVSPVIPVGTPRSAEISGRSPV